MNSKVHIFYVLCSLSSLHAGVIVEKEDLFRLDIVHYNDFHARFEETAVAYPVCSSNSTDCLGGFARLYYKIQELLAEKPGSLLLNAGDSFQGTYWYSLFKWNVTQQFMNLLPHDAFAIGNHEFDDGIVGLTPYLAALNAPVVAANLDTTNEPSMKGLYKPHIIVERHGRKIGIIGLITTETAYTSSPERAIFTDPLTTVEREAKELTEQGVDIIIVLSHCGLNVDKEIAEKYGSNIDIIIGGHTHSLLWNGTNSPSGENIAGPYPVLIESKIKPGHETLIVTASAFTKYLGNLTVWFDKKGEVKAFDGQPIYLNRSIPEDEHVKELLRPYKESLHSIVEEVVGECTGDLLSKTCGYKECAIGNVLADSLLEAGKNRQSSKLPIVSFLLRNNIRGSISKGLITRGAIINTVPYTNKVMGITIKGIHLKDAFEHCLSKFWNENPFNGPFMPQIAGLRLTYNSTMPLGNRVVSIFVKEDDRFKPIDYDRDYKLITYDFIAKGGNDFSMLKENSRNPIIFGTDAEVLEKYIKNHKPLYPVLEGRLTVLT